MPDTRHRSNTKKRKKRRSIFRLSIILLFFIFSIAISFTVYALTFDASSKPVIKENPTNNSSSQSDVLSSDKPLVTDAQGNTVTKPAVSGEAQPAAQTGTNPVAESERKSDDYLSKSVFIGDSITSGLSSYNLIPDENVLASIGLRVDTVETELLKTKAYGDVLVLDALLKIKPENVYILLGSNGVSWDNNDTMLTQYSNFIDDIKSELPDSKIYIISITPVGTKKETLPSAEKGRVLNTEIDAFNQRLLGLANQQDVYYLDMNTKLKGPDGKLPDDISSDGMHFNKDTYKALIEYILTHTV